MVKGSGKGRTASESFAITHQRQILQAKIDRFQSQGLTLMKGNCSKILVGHNHKTEHADSLENLDSAEVDGEGDWLVADIEDIVEEEEPEVTPEKVVLYLLSNFTLQQRKEYGL